MITNESVGPPALAAKVPMRDQKSYCSIYLDDNNRKPICRLRFDSSQKYIGIFDANKKGTKIPINELTEIYLISEKLKETALGYDKMQHVEDGHEENGHESAEEQT